MSSRDRVGLGWRRELAAGIVANLDRVDVVEVIADDYFDAGRRALRALRTLTRQVPVALHGVGLGLASAAPVETRRLERLARVVDAVEPEAWSEHLAFVRGGGVEIGHLAAPPRNTTTVEGATVGSEERLLRTLNERIRDVRMGPDGALWLATDNSAGRVLRLDHRLPRTLPHPRGAFCRCRRKPDTPCEPDARSLHEPPDAPCKYKACACRE